MKKLPVLLLLALGISPALFAAKHENFTVEGGPGGKTFGVQCVVPDAYDGKKPLPTLVLLHGASDNEKMWIERGGDLDALADKYGRLIVAPTAGPFSWYNNHNGSEDFLIKVVLPVVDKRYRTNGDRWITGNSMGGYGALRLGAKYPKLFSAYAGMSPGVMPSRWGKNWSLPDAFGSAVATGE